MVLEYYNYYPITTAPLGQTELLIAELRKQQIEPPQTYNNPIELITDIINEEGRGRTTSTIQNELNQSPIYKSWQNSMPYLKDVPNIQAYRINIEYIASELNREINLYGKQLSPNQILYTGGVHNCNTMQTRTSPTSTTLLPSVAHWHAMKHTGHTPEIAIFHISENSEIKAFVYRTRGNQSLKHEYELLLQSNIRLTRLSKSQHKQFQITEYVIDNN